MAWTDAARRAALEARRRHIKVGQNAPRQTSARMFDARTNTVGLVHVKGPGQIKPAMLKGVKRYGVVGLDMARPYVATSRSGGYKPTKATAKALKKSSMNGGKLLRSMGVKF